MKPGLSVAIITLNEEDYIGQAIDSVQFADEIIVVDSGSTDATVEIAESKGAVVVHQDWLGYGAQKNKALSLCTYEWALSLDADECVTEKLQSEIKKVIARDSPYQGYMIPRLSQFIDRFLYHGGWYPDKQVRLVRNGSGQFSLIAVHESLLVEGKVGQLENDLLHFSYKSISDYIQRMDKYSSLAAEMALEKGKKVGNLALVAAIPRKFLEVYILKRGFLDGIHGFTVACLAAFGLFSRYAKIRWASQKYKSTELQS